MNEAQHCCFLTSTTVTLKFALQYFRVGFQWSQYEGIKITQWSSCVKAPLSVFCKDAQTMLTSCSPVVIRQMINSWAVQLLTTC